MDRADYLDESVRAAPDISRQISAMRRQARLFTAFCLAGFAVGALYVLIATPLYTASSNIMTDDRPVRALHDVSTLSDPRVGDAPDVTESQVEVLRSEKVGLAVIKNLNLVSTDPAFTKPIWIDKIWPSFTAKLDTIIGTAGTLNDADQDLKRRLEVLKKLNSNLRISRVGHTFVLQVDYTSPNPSRAAEIANAYT
ncbi:MAG: Wzz/FepE/Etk N-terminal domain-containing protein, partial [Gammaproteobacteria bacterium]